MARRKRLRDAPAGSKEPPAPPASMGNSPPLWGWLGATMTPLTLAAGAILAIAFGWSYWPTLGILVAAWNREPDYSHGYIVVPLALWFLYARRDSYPGSSPGLAWPGIFVLVLALGCRAVGGMLGVDAVDGWSILLWVAGVVWLFAGWRVLWWSLPSVVFLVFMVPLPYRAERLLSLPLQRIATKLSCWTLQVLGVPSLAEGNVILVNDFPLQVEEACSGLRIFIGIVAVAFAYMVLVRRPLWEKMVLLFSALPITLIANTARIVGTGLCFQWASEESARKFAHDTAGLVMIPFAACLFALVLLYLRRLVYEVELPDVGDFVRRSPG